MTFKVILSSLVLRLSFMYVLSLCGKTKTSEIIGRLAAIKRELKQPRQRQQRKRQKALALNWQNHNFVLASRFFFSCLSSLNDYEVKLPNLTFYLGSAEHKTTILLLFL